MLHSLIFSVNKARGTMAFPLIFRNVLMLEHYKAAVRRSDLVLIAGYSSASLRNSQSLNLNDSS